MSSFDFYELGIASTGYEWLPEMLSGTMRSQSETADANRKQLMAIFSHSPLQKSVFVSVFEFVESLSSQISATSVYLEYDSGYLASPALMRLFTFGHAEK